MQAVHIGSASIRNPARGSVPVSKPEVHKLAVLRIGQRRALPAPSRLDAPPPQLLHVACCFWCFVTRSLASVLPPAAAVASGSHPCSLKPPAWQAGSLTSWPGCWHACVQSAGWLQSLNERHTPETEEYGISSFVYRQGHPAHVYISSQAHAIATKQTFSLVQPWEAAQACLAHCHLEVPFISAAAQLAWGLASW
jgi:hypothetical protein